MSTPSELTFLGGDVPTVSAFLIEVDGKEIGIFREVSGLEVSFKAEDIKEGGQNGYVHKVPTRMEWTDITLKRGVTNSNQLFEWLQKCSGEGFASGGNKVQRLTGAITALDYNGKRLRAWKLRDVMPVKWKGPDFTTGESKALEEQLVITHHGFAVETH